MNTDKIVKLAKSKGFDENFAFDDVNILLSQSERWRCIWMSLLQKWLREEHDVHIEVSYDWITYDVIINKAEDNNRTPIKLSSFLGDSAEYTFTKYEEALEKGLQEALKLI